MDVDIHGLAYSIPFLASIFVFLFLGAYICIFNNRELTSIILFSLFFSDSAVLKALLSRVMEKKDEYGDSWNMVRQNLLFIYKEALSSNCGDLVQMIQVVIIFIKDDLGVYSH